MTKHRTRRFSEWTSTAKTWPLTATLMTILVSLSYLVWIKVEINWLYALIGLPLLCFAITGIIYKLLFPGFKRNNITNLLAHLVWTSIVAVATSLIATMAFHWEILLPIVPVGLIASGITHGKNKTATYSYAAEIMATYMVFLTIPIAIGCSKTIVNSIEGGAHLTKDLGARTANLIHLFSILLSVSFIVAMLLAQKA